MNEQIYITISKALNGEATEAEQHELQAWLEADPENVALYEDMKLLWKDADVLLKRPSFDTSNAWTKISAQITPAPARRTIQLMPWAKYVAAAAIIVMGFLVARLFFIDDKNVILASNDQTVILPDNSTVTLRKGSKLEYPDEFKGSKRKITLDGEAFFEVTHNERQPFVINAQSANVMVLGTSFDVNCSEDKAVVVVKTGKVRLMDKDHSDKSVDLTPGQKGTLKEGAITTEEVDADNYLYWMDGTINFKNRPFYEVTNTLSELYNSVIKLEMSERQKSQIVNISFTNQQLEDMLTELCLITQCQWQKSNTAYVIRPK